MLVSCNTSRSYKRMDNLQLLTGIVLLITILGHCGVSSNGTVNCGDVIHLHKDEEAKVVSGVTNGYCGVLFHAMDTDDITCHKICIQVHHNVIHDCHARVTVSEVRFSRKEEDPKELTCFETLPEMWCVRATTLRIEAIRDLKYSGSNYQYNMTVYPECVTKEEAEKMAYQEQEDRIKSAKDQAYSNMVKGIIVGVCLCCVFLIVLFLTYCYYKNRAYRGKRYDYPPARISKGPTLAGFKAKLNFRKGGANAGASKSTEENLEEKYVKTNDDKKNPESKPLVDAAEATAEEIIEDATKEAAEKQKEQDCKPETDDTKVDIPDQNEAPSNTTCEPTSTAVDIGSSNDDGGAGNDGGGGGDD